MIRATARVLQNVVEMQVEGEAWLCRPVGADSAALTRRIAALFSTTYETFRGSSPTEVHSTVSYSPKKDEILIQVGEDKWRTVSTMFGPVTFQYGGATYTVHEKLTGRFAIFRDGQAVASGEVGFRTVTLRDAPAELEPFFANLALGYLIRKLVWE